MFGKKKDKHEMEEAIEKYLNGCVPTICWNCKRVTPVRPCRAIGGSACCGTSCLYCNAQLDGNSWITWLAVMVDLDVHILIDAIVALRPEYKDSGKVHCTLITSHYESKI